MDRHAGVSRSLRRPGALLALVASALLLAAGCDDDDNGEEGDVAGPDLERYCELSTELDRAGSATFEKLEADPKATEKDFETAEREFVESHQVELDEIQQVAPEEISEDVKTVVDGLRARAGLGPEVAEADQTAAEKRIQAFEKQNC